MRRWVAVLLLVVVSSFLAASGQDHCHDDGNEHQPASPHILCLDDCAPAVIPTPPIPPPQDPLPKPVYEETVVRPILNLDLEPEIAPPRA